VALRTSPRPRATSIPRFDRGVEGFTIAYSLLDVPPYGRQEDWEDLPPGWP
jgi:predicted dithiol-disulfide oxidoreductase (DUF899 family)